MIIPKGKQITQKDAAEAISVFLPTQAYGEASFPTLFFHLPKYIQLSAIDKEVSLSRGPALKWHDAVRNAHRAANGVFVKRRSGGYQLASRCKQTSNANSTKAKWIVKEQGGRHEQRCDPGKQA